MYAISEKIRKKAWWQHHQTKHGYRMPAIICIHKFSMYSKCNLYA
jgi:hypothetical protein